MTPTMMCNLSTCLILALTHTLSLTHTHRVSLTHTLSHIQPIHTLSNPISFCLRGFLYTLIFSLSRLLYIPIISFPSLTMFLPGAIWPITDSCVLLVRTTTLYAFLLGSVFDLQHPTWAICSSFFLVLCGVPPLSWTYIYIHTYLYMYAIASTLAEHTPFVVWPISYSACAKQYLALRPLLFAPSSPRTPQKECSSYSKAVVVLGIQAAAISTLSLSNSSIRNRGR